MSIATFLEKLNNLDLQAVACKLMSPDGGYGWTVEETEMAINHYKMFLYLHFLFPDIELTPTREIDEVWHTHILTDTSVYVQDCHNLYGYILHHRFPVATQDKSKLLERRQNQETACRITEFLFEYFFEVNHLSMQMSACVTLPKEEYHKERISLASADIFKLSKPSAASFAKRCA